MIRKILVPIDSIEWDNTLRAVKSAMTIAEGCTAEGGIELIFTHVLNVKSRISISERKRIMELKEKEIQEEFNMIREMGKERGLENISTISKSGEPATEVIQTAEEEKVDMIVMGSGKLHDKSAAGKVEKFFYGSITEKVIHGTPCSVLISRPRMSLDKILVPIDSMNWDNTEVGIQNAIEIAKNCKVEGSPELILMHILQSDPSVPENVKMQEFESDEERIEEEFEKVKGMAKENGVTNLSTSIKKETDKGLDLEIVDTAKNLDADIIVMGSGTLHDRSVKGRIKKFFLGSVTENVMHESPCSILIARPTAYEE